MLDYDLGMFNGKAMKAARRAGGLTGLELARRVGVTNVTISRIENQRQAPSRDLAERIAQEIGVEVETLYKDDDRYRGTAMSGLSNDERDILDHYRRLDRIAQAKVWAFVIGLASSGSSEGAEAAAELAQAGEAAQQISEAPEDKQAKRA